MDAADPAGDEDADAGGVREQHRRRHRRAAVRAARHRVRQVAPRHLADRAGVAELREALELVVAEPADADAVEHGDRARQRARVAHDRLDGARHLEVFRVRHAVRDDGRLERDDRAVVGDGVADVGADAEVGEIGCGGESEEGEHFEADFARPIVFTARRRVA